MRAEPYEPHRKPAWDALVERSRAAHFLFRRDYMEYHEDRFEDASLLIYEGATLVAALPASRHGDVVSSHGGLTFGGLVADESLGVRRAIEAMRAAVEAFVELGAGRLVYKPVPHIYHRLPAEEDLYALFVHGARLLRRDVAFAIPAGGGAPLSKGRRADVRRGRRSGLRVGADSDWTGFMRIEADLLRDRHGVAPVHDAAELELLAERFPENIRLFSARDGDELLAGLVVYETARVAHAQYMGASRRGRELKAQDVLIDWLLTERYPAKHYFDFGISTEEDGRALNLGLARNKESWGARAIAYDWYEVDLAKARSRALPYLANGSDL